MTQQLKNNPLWQKMRVFYFTIVAIFSTTIIYDVISFYPGVLSLIIGLIGLLILAVSVALFLIVRILIIRIPKHPLANKLTYSILFTISNLLLIARILITVLDLK